MIVCFADNHIRDVGAKAIAEVLNSSNMSLANLNLESNMIGDEGAAALKEALKEPDRSLVTLNLEGGFARAFCELTPCCARIVAGISAHQRRGMRG